MHKCIFFAAISWGLLFQPALADTRDDVWAAMQRCQAIQDDRTWLDCLYGAKQPMRAKLGLPPAPEYQQRLVPQYPQRLAPPPPPSTEANLRKAQPPALPHRRASFLQILTGSAPPVATSPLAAVQYDAQGAFIVTLQNGQIWRQIDAEAGPKARLKVGVGVTIRPGALSSYNLQTEDNPHVYKVEPKS
jgi:hypothetical protein